jgi:DNA ligase-associated metallophosphoesterase
MPQSPPSSDLNTNRLVQEVLNIKVEGIDLQLLAKRGIFWPAKRLLFIADTHFGKEATFRRHGINVPRGSTLATLARIADMLATCSAERLFLLGDMFHASSSISPDIRESIDHFFQSHAHVQIQLVMGNHDRGMRRLIERWPIEIVASGSAIDRISVSHLPQPVSEGTHLLLCGHLHPAYRLSTRTESIGKLPCFWLSNRQLVLPAIGDFTGTQVIQPNKSDQMWIIADGKIVQV